nr:CHAT domain-containing protein [Hyunsoonleella aquatilis]
MISQLIENQSHLLKTNDLLFDLYKVLWKPFANEITTKNIIIIPDGDLYNLSFETLTPTKIESFKELSTNSLLAKHNISYNYSLYLIEQSENTTNYKNSFIAFAPEFNDKMKETYKLAITDSINLDKTYLTLLQQPFNVDLAKAYADVFDGNYFLNENSTERVFKKNASEHKIIHIGTHAESNNISPELSRLLFAKNISDKNEDGSLYAYEIYDTSLNSNLAILTACETGKPSYQAGEGMISLAHAFNYAGSESILTSLWKVDERSTSEIIELFYKNIDEGKPKNEALRLAKLDYIKNTEGRTVAPKFWAGLVLMGDVSPIEISNTTTPWKWLIFIGFVVIGILLFLKLRKANSV